MTGFKIAHKFVGEDAPPLVIAEMGINHGGNLDVAITIADAAIDAGAEIIKHQTHIIEDEMSDEAKNVIPGNADISIYDIIKSSILSEEDELKLMNHIISKNAIFISTPFSRDAAKRLAKFNIPAFKIGSGECNNYPLIKHIAEYGKPIILSTGMNTIEEIKTSVAILRKAKVPFALLHCTNIYPTPPKMVRLNAMTELKQEFPDAVIGLSDHTTSNYTCLGAVALGASILERHFTDTIERQGPDIICSMDPHALKELIHGSRIIYEARGGSKGLLPEEIPTANFAFASVVAIQDIEKNEALTKDNIWVKRPGGGDFSAKEYESLLGKMAKRKILKDTQLKMNDIKIET